MTTLVLGMDIETTSLDIATCEVIEIAAVVLDLDGNKDSAVVALVDHLVLLEKQFTVPKEITGLTGITQEYLDLFGLPPTLVATAIGNLIRKVPVIFAHNGEAFDRPIITRFIKTFAPEFSEDVNKAAWVDTLYDLPYPEETTSRRLIHLAADHGIYFNHSHRALFDVLAMLEIAQKYDVRSIIENAGSPWITVVARVSYDDRSLAAKRGYQWDATARLWKKKIRGCTLQAEKDAATFPVLTYP